MEDRRKRNIPVPFDRRDLPQPAYVIHRIVERMLERMIRRFEYHSGR